MSDKRAYTSSIACMHRDFAGFCAVATSCAAVRAIVPVYYTIDRTWFIMAAAGLFCHPASPSGDSSMKQCAFANLNAAATRNRTRGPVAKFLKDTIHRARMLLWTRCRVLHSTAGLASPPSLRHHVAMPMHETGTAAGAALTPSRPLSHATIFGADKHVARTTSLQCRTHSPSWFCRLDYTP